MKVDTILKEQVGWLDDVGVESVVIETTNEKGERSVLDCWLDDEIKEDVGLGYFYALNPEGFYWGHFGSGEYCFVDFMGALLNILEIEDVDDTWLAHNPKRIGSIVTDSIIDDKDMFESFWYLKSYQDIYRDFPAIDCLRDYLTEYYETYIEAAFPEEVERARLKRAFNR